MVIYELKVNKWEPMVFEYPVPALTQAVGWMSDRRNRVTLTRKTYQDDGMPLGKRRLSVRLYQKVLRTLSEDISSMGLSCLSVIHVRKTDAGEEEGPDDPYYADASKAKEIAAEVAEFVPSSSLVIDDYGYSPRFYDVFRILRVYGYDDANGKHLLYETPTAEPKPHVMDY